MTKTVFHKASALLLSAVMATTAFCSALAVSAAEPDNASDDAKPMVYHIDRSRTANLTVYKYEVPDTSVAYSGSTGEKDDEAHIPEEAKPLKGVTFAAHKFAELDEYFTEASSEIPKTEDYREDKVTATFTATTGADGVTKQGKAIITPRSITIRLSAISTFLTSTSIFLFLRVPMRTRSTEVSALWRIPRCRSADWVPIVSFPDTAD